MTEEYVTESIKNGKKRFSKICIMFVVATIMSYAVIMALSILIENTVALDMRLKYYTWIMLFVNSLLPILTALFFSLLTHNETVGIKYASERMSAGRFFVFVAEILPVTFIGSIIGSAFSQFISRTFSVETTDMVSELLDNIGILEMFVFTVIIAPIFEELCFRKILIDKLSQYGTAFCTVFSGLTFGVYHGNFYQFFYAAAIGMLFAYIYCSFGKLRYTIALHMIVNFFGSVAAVTLADFIQSDIEWKQIFASLYAICYFMIFVLGACFLARDIKKGYFRAFPGVFSSPFKVLIPTVGFIVFAVFSILIFVLYV